MFNDTRGELLIEMIPFLRLLTSRRKAGDGRSVEASVGLTAHHGNSMKVDHGINALNIGLSHLRLVQVFITLQQYYCNGIVMEHRPDFQLGTK